MPTGYPRSDSRCWIFRTVLPFAPFPIAPSGMSLSCEDDLGVAVGLAVGFTVAVGVGFPCDVDAGERHKHDAAVFLKFVLQAEEFDLVACPGKVSLTKVGGVADQ